MGTTDVTVRTYFREADQAVSKGVVEGLAAAMDHVLGVSNGRVPVRTGELRGSGRSDVDAATLVGAVSYGGPFPLGVVAVKQHEDLTARHPNGQAKYLESAFGSEIRQLERLVAARVRART